MSSFTAFWTLNGTSSLGLAVTLSSVILVGKMSSKLCPPRPFLNLDFSGYFGGGDKGGGTGDGGKAVIGSQVLLNSAKDWNSSKSKWSQKTNK